MRSIAITVNYIAIGFVLFAVLYEEPRHLEDIMIFLMMAGVPLLNLIAFYVESSASKK